jgi:hypothetical protein
MSGGAISGNTGGNQGGGVYVSGGTFTMEAGTISGNTVAAGMGNEYGGGVYSSGTFTMSGGAISGNTASTASTDYSYSSYGGGVYSSGTFTMSGGEISGNTASTTYASSSYSSIYSYGGGVYSSGTFTMSGGAISGNTASSPSSYSYSSNGGGVYSSGTFTKQGGTIYGSNADSSLKNIATSGASYGHAVYIEGGKVRSNTADAGVNLDGSVSGTAGGWETTSVQISLQPTSSDPQLSNTSLSVSESASFSVYGYYDPYSGYISYTWYTWYLDGKAVVSDATSSSYSVGSYSKAPGVYELSVVVTTSAGETLSARCMVVVKAY